MTRINTNVPSLVAQNRLQRSNNSLQTALTRLSTGLKINTGADDPAGLIASEALRSEITSANKAISNTRRANQIIATADSALAQVSSLLNDVRGLVVEAANDGALSDDEIAANQLQVDSSLEAINRIAQTTTFQGRKLLDGGLDFLTTAGSNFSKVKNLSISSANLGATGNVALSVSVTSAATRAQVDVANIPASSTAGTDGTITVTNAAAAATTTAQSTTAGGSYTISADPTGSYAGAAGNDASVEIVAGTTTALTQASSAAHTTTDSGEFTIDALAGGGFDGSKGNAVTVNVVAGTTTATAQGATASLATSGTSAGAYTISAKAGGAFDGSAGANLTINITAGATAGGAAEATLTGNTLDITINSSGEQTLADIKLALDGITDFSDDFEFTVDSAGDFDSTTANDDQVINGLTGGASEVAEASLAGNVLTITVDDNGSQTLANIKAALEADGGDFQNNFTFEIANAGTFAPTGDDTPSALTSSGGTSVAAEAALVGDVLTITVDEDTTTNTLTDIEAALTADATFGGEFVFNVEDATGTFDPTNDLLAATQLANGADAGATDTINITTPAGAAYNGTITIATSSSVTAGAPTATLDADNNLTITVNDTAATDLSDIVDAINDLTGYTAELDAGNAGDGAYTPGVGNDTIGKTDITDATDGGITQDVVFELAGATGSEVFNVSAGTDIDQLIAQINLVKDATGVQASKTGTTLELQSVEYGSASQVDLRIISEGASGTFTAAVGAGSRASGTDAVAKVNGIDASTKGNHLSINTATLDLDLDVEAGFEGSLEFNITGGGARFQLGPNVVSNQQARIGISSVNTARLGGTSGRLFQLGSGGSAALATDPTTASQIVNEAISQVTSLRGRLGAFQRTTLDSNIASLTDSVANLLEAESSIRDADFAQESANLTRSQILVQSGTNVLSLANQNPQNVLSLLR